MNKYDEVCRQFGEEFFATRGQPSQETRDRLHAAMDYQVDRLICKCGHLEKDHTITREEMGGMTIHNQCSKCGCYGYEIPNHPSEKGDEDE